MRGKKGTPMDKFRGHLDDATTLKAGNLTPVEKVASAPPRHLPDSQGHCQLPQTAPCTRGLHEFQGHAHPSRTCSGAFPHMLPAVARTIIRGFDAIARLFAMTVDKKCTL